MATFVLVHGAWHGAWCYRRVARLLTARGHEVFTPTLTGVADRSHLLTADINIDTHIADVVNLITWEQLTDIVLVGHSYGGMVISGVAEKTEQAIRSLVFLDAFIPENGESVVDLTVAATRGLLEAAQAAGTISVPPRSAESFYIDEKNRAWVDAQCTPQPIKTFTQKVKLTGARERIAKKTYIRGAGYPAESFDAAMGKARARGWHVHALPCGHDVMVDMPERLADLLHEAA